MQKNKLSTFSGGKATLLVLTILATTHSEGKDIATTPELD